MGGRGDSGSRDSPDRPDKRPSASSTLVEILDDVEDDTDTKDEGLLFKKENPLANRERARSKKFTDLKPSAVDTDAAVEALSPSPPPQETAPRPRHVSTKEPPTPSNRLSWSMLAGARVGSGNVGAASTAHGGDSPGGGLVGGSTTTPLVGAKTESAQDKRSMSGRSTSAAPKSNDISFAFGLRRRDDSDEEEWVINGEGQYMEHVLAVMRWLF